MTPFHSTFTRRRFIIIVIILIIIIVACAGCLVRTWDVLWYGLEVLYCFPSAPPSSSESVSVFTALQQCCMEMVPISHAGHTWSHPFCMVGAVRQTGTRPRPVYRARQSSEYMELTERVIAVVVEAHSCVATVTVSTGEYDPQSRQRQTAAIPVVRHIRLHTVQYSDSVVDIPVVVVASQRVLVSRTVKVSQNQFVDSVSGFCNSDMHTWCVIAHGIAHTVAALTWDTCCKVPFVDRVVDVLVAMQR